MPFYVNAYTHKRNMRDLFEKLPVLLATKEQEALLFAKTTHKLLTFRNISRKIYITILYRGEVF